MVGGEVWVGKAVEHLVTKILFGRVVGVSPKRCGTIP